MTSTGFNAYHIIWCVSTHDISTHTNACQGLSSFIKPYQSVSYQHVYVSMYALICVDVKPDQLMLYQLMWYQDMSRHIKGYLPDIKAYQLAYEHRSPIRHPCQLSGQSVCIYQRARPFRVDARQLQGDHLANMYMLSLSLMNGPISSGLNARLMRMRHLN